MINKLFLSITLLLIGQLAWSCPGCAGSMDNPGANKTVFILATFILLTYIPFFLIYKTVFKYRKGTERYPRLIKKINEKS